LAPKVINNKKPNFIMMQGKYFIISLPACLW